LYINIIVDNNKKRVDKRKREDDHTKEDGKKVKLEVKLEVKGKCGIIVLCLYYIFISLTFHI